MAARSWLKWLVAGVLVGVVMGFPAAYDEMEYEKLLEMMEAMTAGQKHGGIPSEYRGGDFGDGDLHRFAEMYSDKDYPMDQRLAQQQNQVEAPEDDAPLEQGDLVVDEDWQQEEKLSDQLIFGQVGGLATCQHGHVNIFHRADRSWEPESFTDNETYTEIDQGPISEPTIFKADRETGQFVKKWGANLFYLPHGITIDGDNNYWLTDVALHQVFKFEEGGTEPLLTLGKRFEPGTNDDRDRFCKPTDVAVASNGDIFVADGYCNSRVVKFNSAGEYQAQFGDDDFYTPHSLALAEELDMICVADRDNRRILCYSLGLEDPTQFGVIVRDFGNPRDDKKTFLGRVFAIEYSPKKANSGEGQFLYGVRGPEPVDSAATVVPMGFTIDLADDNRFPYDIISWWSPWDQGFHEPHDLAVTPDGDSVFVGELDDNTVWKFDKPRDEL